MARGTFYLHEHPATALSWKEGPIEALMKDVPTDTHLFIIPLRYDLNQLATKDLREYFTFFQADAWDRVLIFQLVVVVFPSLALIL